MILNRFYVAVTACAGLAALTLTGCESPDWSRSLSNSFAGSDQPNPRLEEQYREEYAATRSAKSMRWLFSHCVEMGMSYKQVCQIMKEEGTPVTGERHLLAGGSYRLGDDVYAFGPDTNGKTVYLVFRDDRLINYDRSEFK